MTTPNPSFSFPDPSDQSPNPRAKRKWTQPHLTVERLTHTASGKPNPVVVETNVFSTHGPVS
jgi:hypothetical protein